MRMQKSWGDGTVYQESVNKWTAKISLGTTPDGKALFKRFSAKTKGEVGGVKRNSFSRQPCRKDLPTNELYDKITNGISCRWKPVCFTETDGRCVS